MLRIHYQPVMREDGTRKVFVNSTYFTKLRMNKADKLLLTDKEHPHVNLVKLFEAAVIGDMTFDSFRYLLITIKVT